MKKKCKGTLTISDIEFVRQAVGHASIATTVKYIVPSRNAKEEAGDIMDKLLV